MRLLTDKAPLSIRKQRLLRCCTAESRTAKRRKERAGEKQAEREQRQDGGRQGRAGSARDLKWVMGVGEEQKRDAVWGWMQTGMG